MNHLTLTLPTIAENVALDEALLLEAEAGRSGEVLRLYEWPTLAVVLGAGCKLTEDVDEARCQGDGVQVLRRSSGGGTVLLGAGCLCYSLVLAYDRSPALREIPFSNIFILDAIRSALADLVPNIERAGTSDLMIAGQKFSGNAQQRKRTHLLHHGTLLYGFDLPAISRYLHSPQRQPDYRQQRDHLAFVRNLPVSRPDLEQRLRQAWPGDLSTDWPVAAVAQLVQEKYGTREWVTRR